MPIVDIDGVFTQTFQIKKYNFYVCNIQLHTSITLVISLQDADDRDIHTIHKIIEGEEYDAWGTDDSYLEGLADKYVKEFLNIA
jgi:uncharacterized HAD superfamily protein